MYPVFRSSAIPSISPLELILQAVPRKRGLLPAFRRQQTNYVAAAPFVHAYLGLGDNEQALVWLERAHQEQSNILHLLKVHPYFDPLREDPRFRDLVHKVGLDSPH